jgi:hypothetical protein
MMQTTAIIDHFDGDDYNLRLLIERMQRMRSSEREIEEAVREASGCLSHPASPRRTARRLRGGGRLWKRQEGQR